ncbi:hypothetical protein P2318_14495 [Myxococcaceae bacterium GXIMD 01537]
MTFFLARQLRRLTTALRATRAAGGLLTLLAAGAAPAAAVQIEARTEAQAYQIRAWRGSTPDDPVLLPRRRIVQYLGLNAFELITGEDLGFESNMRVFADLGLPRGEAARLDGVKAEAAELLYAFARYGTGGFEAKLGRQLYTDVIDIMAFDGLRLRYVSRLGLGAEVYAGLWVKGSSFAASPVYQLDGTRESDDRRLEAGVAGADPVLDAVEPVVGAKLLLENLSGFSGSVGYRRAVVEGKTDLERATAELRYGRGRGLTALAGVDFDLLRGELAQARAQVRYDADRYAVSAEALRFTPVLSADSIWYYFAYAPRDEARARLDLLPVGPLRYYVQGVASLYHTDINPTLLLADSVDAPGAPPKQNVGGSVGAAYQRGGFRSALDVTYRTGFGGEQLWSDLTAGYSWQRGLFTLDGRLSYAYVDDGFNPLLVGNFLGAQVWASRALSRAARISLALEQNVNRFTDWDSRVFFLFDLKANL